MSSSYCQTCYSQLASSASPYHTPCCHTPICDACISRNPRLRYYDPCLRCGDVRTSSGEDRIKAGKARAAADRQAEENGQFAIGDDEDDDHDRPPSYSEEAPSGTLGESHKASGSSSGSRRSSVSSNVQGKEVIDDAKEPEEDDTEIVEVKHPVVGSDTLFNIAKRYAADPYDLLSLNNLPPSALTSNPRIIQTRKTLVISRRRIRRSALPNPLVFDADADVDAGEALDPAEEARREEEKKIKRFQLITKTTDMGVGKAYLGLAELSEGQHPLELGSGEALEGAIARGTSGGEKKKVHGGGREDRALDAFWEDAAWEADVGGPERVKVNGRWTVVGSGGSRFAGLSIKS